MSKVLVTDTHLTDIAAAIRQKNGESTRYRPGEMAQAILNIPGGGYPEPTGTINITSNGTHNVKSYASANVNVQPVLQSKTATQNGTVTPDSGYDGLSSVVVNVSGGADGATFSLGAPQSTSGYNNGDFFYQRVGAVQVYSSMGAWTWDSQSNTYSQGQKLRCVTNTVVVGFWIRIRTPTNYLHLSTADGTDLAAVTITDGVANSNRFVWLDSPVYLSAGDEIVAWYSGTGPGYYRAASDKTPTNPNFEYISTVYKAGVNVFPNSTIANNLYPIDLLVTDSSVDEVVVRQWKMQNGAWVVIG